MDNSENGGIKLKKKPFINDELVEKLKLFAAPIGLLITLMVYTVVGGLIFRQLELPPEIIRLGRLRTTLLTQRNQLVNKILNNTDIQLSNLEKVIKFELRSYELELQEAAQRGFSINYFDNIDTFDDRDIAKLPPIVTDRWSILQAVFFASTVLTTIGYGNVVPTTYLGRIFCIFFAFVGIPLTLTVIADWGKLFAEAVSKLTAVVYTSLPALIKSWIPQNIAGRRSLGAFAAITLLFLYLSCGAAMFMLWEEDWGFFDGFYFCFVTMTTIGFGDLVPKRPKYMLFCTLYILVGLALTGTIIELVRRQYAQSWRRLQALRGPLAEALRKIGEQAGGDVSTLQSDLRKVLTVISMPKFKRKNGKMVEMQDIEWQEAIEEVLRDIAADSSTQIAKNPIFQIVIYESSV